MTFRHEWKHEITPLDAMVLEKRLQAVARPDCHTVDGVYRIRSLYFDNPGDKALREKIDGVARREKFRLRCYNGDYSLILLEKKSKQDALGSKCAAHLTLPQVRDLLAGERLWMRSHPSPLVRELYVKMTVQGLGPKTIVDYTRRPFVYPAGNVRVTLDSHIRTGLGSVAFLDPGCLTVPVRGDPVILEVKWDGFLPDLIRQAVQIPGRRAGAYSKYAACRVYG